MMKRNIQRHSIERIRMAVDAKRGCILMTGDGKGLLGVAARDLEEGEIVRFCRDGNTDDVLTHGDTKDILSGYNRNEGSNGPT